MKPNYCLACGSALSKVSDTEYICESKHQYWNNPHGASTIILIKDGEALFSKRGVNPKKGMYDFPGGFLEFNESSVDAARRELKEETGLEAEDLELIDSSIHSYVPYTSVCDLVYVCRSWRGTIKPADDVETLEWKPIKFIESPEFAWSYPGLIQKLENL